MSASIQTNAKAQLYRLTTPSLLGTKAHGAMMTDWEKTCLFSNPLSVPNN